MNMEKIQIKREPSSPERLCNRVWEAFTPKQEELDRVFTKEELISFCIHKKCMVDLRLWNPVYRSQQRLKRKGQFQNKSPKEVNKMLEQILNEKLDCIQRSFPKEFIDDEREMNWEWRKSWNVRWLNHKKKFPGIINVDELEENKVIVKQEQQSPNCVPDNNIPNACDMHPKQTAFFRNDFDIDSDIITVAYLKPTPRWNSYNEFKVEPQPKPSVITEDHRNPVPHRDHSRNESEVEAKPKPLPQKDYLLNEVKKPPNPDPNIVTEDLVHQKDYSHNGFKVPAQQRPIVVKELKRLNPVQQKNYSHKEFEEPPTQKPKLIPEVGNLDHIEDFVFNPDEYDIPDYLKPYFITEDECHSPVPQQDHSPIESEVGTKPKPNLITEVIYLKPLQPKDFLPNNLIISANTKLITEDHNRNPVPQQDHPRKEFEVEAKPKPFHQKYLLNELKKPPNPEPIIVTEVGNLDHIEDFVFNPDEYDIPDYLKPYFITETECHSPVPQQDHSPIESKVGTKPKPNLITENHNRNPVPQQDHSRNESEVEVEAKPKPFHQKYLLNELKKPPNPEPIIVTEDLVHQKDCSHNGFKVPAQPRPIVVKEHKPLNPVPQKTYYHKEFEEPPTQKPKLIPEVGNLDHIEDFVFNPDEYDIPDYLKPYFITETECHSPVPQQDHSNNLKDVPQNESLLKDKSVLVFSPEDFQPMSYDESISAACKLYRT